jgi:hypothetical protein
MTTRKNADKKIKISLGVPEYPAEAEEEGG